MRDSLDSFTLGYITCALWSSTDNADESGGEPLGRNYDIEDIEDDTLKVIIKDCATFQEKHKALLAKAYKADVWVEGERYNESCAGHDFWLTRCGHGAGFWDRGLSKVGDKLTELCGYGTEFPPVDLMVEDGKVYGA